MLRIWGHSRDEDEARRSWTESIDCVGQLIARIPSEYDTQIRSFGLKDNPRGLVDRCLLLACVADSGHRDSRRLGIVEATS